MLFLGRTDGRQIVCSGATKGSRLQLARSHWELGEMRVSMVQLRWKAVRL